jgi:hypothetical protein
MEIERASYLPPWSQVRVVNKVRSRTEEPFSIEEEQLRVLLRINKESGGRVAEDFVDLSIPGYEGSTPSGSSKGVAASPILMITSLTGGATCGGGFGGITGKKFGAVKIFDDDGACLVFG